MKDARCAFLTNDPNVEKFLTQAGWGDAVRVPIPGDASPRQYIRLHKGDAPRLMMVSPSATEKLAEFIKIAQHLNDVGLSAPEVYDADIAAGYALIEDFGAQSLRQALTDAPDTASALYETAVSVLAHLHNSVTPKGLPPYDLEMHQREADLFITWFWPTMMETSAPPLEDFQALVQQLWAGRRDLPECLVLRDYHVDNVMVVPRPGVRQFGLLDFQDGVIGCPSYDLVSLIEDARWDSPGTVDHLLDVYLAQRNIPIARADLLHNMRIEGFIRHLKVLGIFCRLWKRDGKDAYRQHLPRVWGYVQALLQHDTFADWRPLLREVRLHD